MKHKNCDKGTALNLFNLADGFACLEREKEMDFKPLDPLWRPFIHALLYRITNGYYPDGAVEYSEHNYSPDCIEIYQAMGIPDYFFKA